MPRWPYSKLTTPALALVLLCAVSGSSASQQWTYMDDRSTPQKLIESYYYAINNRYYVQAYGYFKQGSAPQDFDEWAKGYADTKSVSVKFGSTAPDPGAGQIYWALPVVIEAVQTDGKSKVYTGCYKIHMTNLGMQTDPPYEPMGIVSASLKETSSSFDDTKAGNC
ncbi:hypothetical protein ABVF61_23685 [Roseibium sp. HPY-6]|uniref:hypothetical protein n=1 Tax=Roseibium sp. HPY-6 TaxID=3229852 RepID=UPI00338D44E9